MNDFRYTSGDWTVDEYEACIAFELPELMEKWRLTKWSEGEPFQLTPEDIRVIREKEDFLTVLFEGRFGLCDVQKERKRHREHARAYMNRRNAGGEAV